MAKFKIGDKVCWTSSCKDKSGEIIAIVPAGSRSGAYGYNPKGALWSRELDRDHESYIIGVRKKSNPSEFYSTNFWPVVSLLRKREAANA